MVGDRTPPLPTGPAARRRALQFCVVGQFRRERRSELPLAIKLTHYRILGVPGCGGRFVLIATEYLDAGGPFLMQATGIVIGTDEHKELFCRTFIDTHDPYDPHAMDWPVVDAGALARLRAMPFWGEAISTERDVAK